MKINQFFISSCLSFFSIYCAFAELPTEEKLSSISDSFSISKELSAWNNKQPLPLQDHQLKPIAYLEQNKDIKGLIINHWLGTGKTLLAIGFAERNPKNPIIILAPDFLKGHWMEELAKYGVKDTKRYRFVSHDNPEAIVKEDLFKTIIIIDESHRLIKKVRSSNLDAAYAPLYLKFRKAHRILSLTGTPIYADLFDLVYQINLVSGKEQLPFNKEAFRVNYSKINGLKSYWRGHLLESSFVASVISFACQSFEDFLKQGMKLHPIWAYITAPIPNQLYLMIPYFSNIHSNPIRNFDVEQFKKLVEQYVSYHNFDRNERFYPKKSFTAKTLDYSDAQLSALYRFYDSRLTREELKQLSKDQATEKESLQDIQKANYYINNSALQDAYKSQRGAGREIGNLLFVNQLDIDKLNQESKSLVEKTHSLTIFPEKFKSILAEIKLSKGPVIVYSHYYYNGLLLFKQFLDSKGYQEKYKIFHPKISNDQNQIIIEDYNNDKVKILLLHPDITEGISLKGTRQVHFLEMPTSSELANQIIGRAIRYQSHSHLPQKDQHVTIYYWCYGFRMLDPRPYIASRENWYHNFSELNYYALHGRKQVDNNYYIKEDTPDMLAYCTFNSLKLQTKQFRSYVRRFCIENKYINEGC